jgi:ethanolamine utilization protein EutQ (cupin superfamily)
VPELIPGPVQIPVPGGKTIEEFVGLVATGHESVSIAHMIAPAGWEEPAQTPEFDEFTLVLDGSIVVEADDGPTLVSAGQAVFTRSGERIRYTTPDGARYIAICVPAFAPDLVHREDVEIDADW